MTTAMSVAQQTEATLGHHLQSLTAKDLEATLNDYTDESILFTPSGVVTGLDALRGFFTQFVQVLTPEFMSNFKLERQDIRGEFAYITWSSGAAVPFGLDSFQVRNGKIVWQTFGVYMAG
ncbi:MAG: nuclear transport factor 2 family protein [Chloroflexi bacterium]|nr:nuclear transport factor 2 family protein [Chloroflexota bacterium]